MVKPVGDFTTVFISAISVSRVPQMSEPKFGHLGIGEAQIIE